MFDDAGMKYGIGQRWLWTAEIMSMMMKPHIEYPQTFTGEWERERDKKNNKWLTWENWDTRQLIDLWLCPKKKWWTCNWLIVKVAAVVVVIIIIIMIVYRH